MKRFIAALFAAVLLVCAPAAADPTGSLYVISSASPTSCTVIAPNAVTLFSVWNESTSAQTVTITLYNDRTCTAGDQVYSGVLGASQVINWPAVTNWFPRLGLSYTLSAAASNYIEVLW